MVRINFLVLLLSTSVLVSLCKSPGGNSQTASGNDPVYALSDPQADTLAGILFRNLSRLSDDFILVGHQDALAYGMGWKGDEFRTDINDVCGDFPAVFGWDLGHIGEPENIDGVPFEKMKRWMIEVYKRGGINTVSWHIRNIVSDGSSWDTSTCVRGILPGGEFHQAYIEKLDLVSDLFSSLKTGKGDLIPVLFRPFHEMNGDWFWWGSKSCTPEEYKALFQFTVNYLREEKQLHNLIYVYSSDVFFTEEEYLTFYPGDNYVDVLGFDDYKGLVKKENTHRTVAMLEMLNTLGMERSKLITISETGVETIPDETWFTSVVLPTLKTNDATMKASWILFWRNGRPDHFYAPYPGHPSAWDFIKFKEDSLTLFLSGTQGIYKSDYNADLP
jgi:mannan endo-1,4-beta-mannosidase